MRKRLLTIAFVMLFSLIAVNMSMAQTATVTGALSVTATVENSCRIISVGEVAFGAYDTTNPADNDNGNGNIVFQCVQGTSYRTFIAGTRTMSGTSGDTLTFQLFSDAGRTVPYPSTASGGMSIAGDNDDITSDVYGRITARQDVIGDNYSTTLTATVEY